MISAPPGRLIPGPSLQPGSPPLTPPPAQVILSPEAGRVSVFGPPSVQVRAAKVLDDVQATASQRIAMEVAVYFVRSDKADEFSLALAKLGDGLAGEPVGTEAGGTDGGGTLTLSRGSYTMSFAALARSASVVDYRLGATTTQSGVIAPIIVRNKLNYLRSVELEITDKGTKTTLEVEDLETGISITAQPRLIAPNQVQLALTIIQRELVELNEFQAPGVKSSNPLFPSALFAPTPCWRLAKRLSSPAMSKTAPNAAAAAWASCVPLAWVGPTAPPATACACMC